MPFHDFADEEWVEDELDDAGNDLLLCPRCRREVHEDTQQCPHCGDWITPVYPHESTKRTVWLVAAILVVLALILITVM